MKSIAHKRKESILFREISSIICEKLENTNISYVTVTDVKLSGDQSFLKIYVIFQKNAEQSLANLNHTKGFINSQLAKLKTLKKIPKIVFEIDKTSKQAFKIEKILQKLKDKNNN